LVREGAVQGEVIAEFDLTVDHPARAVLAEAGLPVGDTLILRRVNARDGRKSAWVNDRRASGEVLRALSDTLVELHGQNDDRGLLNPSGHRRLLDTFGDLDDLVARCRAAWRDLQGARAALTEAEEVAAALAEEEDFLRHAVGELTELSADAGEDASLDSRRRMMQGAEKIREDVTRAYTALGSGGAEGMMRDASRWLDEAAEQAEGALDTPMAALERAMVELGDAEDGIARALEALAFDVSELERVEERLFAIRALARKHNVLPDALSDLTATLGAKLAALDGGAAELADLKAAVLDAEDVYDTAADALGAARAQAAEALDTAMAKELAPLKLERAVFATDIAETDAGPDGRDTVAFTIATNPGAPSGALNKIASGGELSRFLLALKVCLTSGVDGLTLIFDEIDRGVGGATADAVGRRLAELSVDSQVLVVTHSPQVAARGAHHWRVEKSVTKGATLSTVVALDDLERIDEVARMLSGDTVTDAARVAAKTLLNA